MSFMDKVKDSVGSAVGGARAFGYSTKTIECMLIKRWNEVE